MDNIDDRIECNPRKLVKRYWVAEGAADMLKSCYMQKLRLEKWVDMVLGKGKFRILHWEWNNGLRVWLARKQLCRKESGSPDGQQVEHESAVYSCSKGSQKHSELYYCFYWDTLVSFPLSSTMGPQMECHVQFRASHYKKYIDLLEQVQCMATRIIGVWSSQCIMRSWDLAFLALTRIS